MATKTWTSQSDWQEWDWDAGADLDTSPGDVMVAAGHDTAVGTSPVFEATDWTGWRVFKVEGSRPAGTIYYLRFRTGETQGGCASADWSEYIDGVDADGTIVFDLRTWCRNNEAFEVGPWIQFELTLETD